MYLWLEICAEDYPYSSHHYKINIPLQHKPPLTIFNNIQCPNTVRYYSINSVWKCSVVFVKSSTMRGVWLDISHDIMDSWYHTNSIPWCRIRWIWEKMCWEVFLSLIVFWSLRRFWECSVSSGGVVRSMSQNFLSNS